MKLVSNKQKRTTAIIAIAVAIVALIAIIGVVVLLTSLNTPDSEEPPIPTLAGIAVSREPKTTYFIGEKFDPSNILVQVVMTEQSATYFIDATDPDLTFSGFDSSLACEKQTITVTYKGVSTTFDIKIVDNSTLPDPNDTTMEVCNMKLTYSLTVWNARGPSASGAYVVIHNPDGTSYGSIEETYLSNDNIRGYEKVDGPCQFDLTVFYRDKNGNEYSTTVTVTITE